jgi:hypothetical protein
LKARLFHFAQPVIFSSAFGRFGNKFHLNIMEILAKTALKRAGAWKLLSPTHGKLNSFPGQNPRHYLRPAQIIELISWIRVY